MGVVWQAPGRTDTRQAVREACNRGAVACVVDGGAVHHEAAFVDAACRALRIPAQRGRSIQALYDGLIDLSWQPSGEVVLVWSRPDELRRRDVRSYQGVMSLLRNAVAATRNSAHPLSVILTVR